MSILSQNWYISFSIASIWQVYASVTWLISSSCISNSHTWWNSAGIECRLVLQINWLSLSEISLVVCYLHYQYPTFIVIIGAIYLVLTLNNKYIYKVNKNWQLNKQLPIKFCLIFLLLGRLLEKDVYHFEKHYLQPF